MRMTPIIPKQLEGIYDKEKYTNQQAYQKMNSRLGLYMSLVSFIGLSIVLVFKLFGWLDQFLREYVSDTILLSMLFLGIFYVLNEIISLPFSYYSTFTIEEKFGFNKSTRKLFWLDQIKSFVITTILGGAIIILLVWLLSNISEYWWVYAWIAITLLSLFMTFFYSDLIVPLFNKQEPLKEGELRTAIEDFAGKAGFELKNIYVMDASKRSSKANAYFTGFGNKKRIVLYDTLINDLTTEEIVAVLAHEIGHYKKRHILYSLIGSVIYTGIILFLLSLFIGDKSLALAFGSEVPSFHLGIIAFSILFSPISVLIGIFLNMISRKNEYEADAFAAGLGLSGPLIEGLKKLSVKSLSNLNPDRLYVFVYYSHPTLLQRINKINSEKDSNSLRTNGNE